MFTGRMSSMALDTTILAKNKKVLLYLILFIALILRVQKIQQPYIDAFSWRQCSTAMMAENFYKKSWNIFMPEVNWTGPGPSYQGREFQTVSYISALLYVVVGQQDWVGRMVAIFFGIWGLFALFQLVKIVWDENHALATAAIYALIPGNIFIERSFLPDPVMVSLVITSLWMLVKYLQTDRRLYLALAAVSGCLGFLTKIPGMLVALPMLYATVSTLRDRKAFTISRVLPLLGVALLVLVVVASYYLWARHLSLTYPPYHFAGSGSWIWDTSIRKWLEEKYFFSNMKYIAVSWLWGIPVLALTCIGLLLPPPYFKPANRITNHTSLPWLFHVWLFGCIFFYLIGASELIHNPWNFHIFSPVIAVFSGRALVMIATFENRDRSWILARAFIIALFIFASSILNLRTLYAEKNPSYKMGLALKKVSKPGDLVLTVADHIGDPVSIFYSTRRGWVFPPADKWAPIELPEDDSTSITALEKLRGQGAGWLGIVQTHFDDIKKNHPSLYKHLSHYRLAGQTPEYVVYQLKASILSDIK